MHREHTVDCGYRWAPFCQSLTQEKVDMSETQNYRHVVLTCFNCFNWSVGKSFWHLHICFWCLLFPLNIRPWPRKRPPGGHVPSTGAAASVGLLRWTRLGEADDSREMWHSGASKATRHMGGLDVCLISPLAFSLPWNIKGFTYKNHVFYC